MVSVRYHFASVVSSQLFVKIIFWIPLILRRRKFDPHIPKPDFLQPEPDLPPITTSNSGGLSGENVHFT